jgi:hypothetical protein
VAPTAAKFTIRPKRCSRMWGTVSRHMWKTESRLEAMIRCHSGGSSSSSGFQLKLPTVFTSTSIRRQRASVRVTSARACSKSVTSARTACASPPRSWICAATASAPAKSCRALTTTRAFSAPAARAIAAPRPRALPVTRITLPRRPSSLTCP